MARIAGMARSNQPGLLVVDRTVCGEYENYVTPEQTIPEEPLPIHGKVVLPWVIRGVMYPMILINQPMTLFICCKILFQEAEIYCSILGLRLKAIGATQHTAA